MRFIVRFWLRFWAKRSPSDSFNIRGKSPNPNLYPIHRFQPLETFVCDENGTTYVKGYIYHVLKGDQQLKRLMKRWYRKNMVAIEQKKKTS